MEDHVVQELIVDAGGFIKNAPLRNIGERIYSLGDVVNEIRDKATKQRLQVLPYQIKFREPSAEAIRFVTDFSKKTGDFPSLSATDIRVIALTCMLEKEFAGGDHIKKVPERRAVWTETRKTLEKATDVAGFYLGPKKGDQGRSRSTTECSSLDDELRPSREADARDKEDLLERVTTEGTDTEQKSQDSERHQKDTTIEAIREEAGVVKDDINVTNVEKDTSSLDIVVTESNLEKPKGADDSENSERTCADTKIDSLSGDFVGLKEGDVIADDEIQEGSDSEDDEDDDDDDDDDGGGWITPQNIVSVKKSMKNVNEENQKVTVGCLTTDFAMQNVLLQMGLNVISVDGMLIKRTKSYVLRCYACNKVTTKMTLLFCPNCGNETLRKVSMTVAADGSIQYFMSKRRAPTTRGKNQSLPAPKGGKHSHNPILCADQPFPQQKPPRKALGRTNVFDPDYDTKTSPFSINDVTSRAAQLGIQQRPRNNQSKKRQGKRR